MGVQVGHCTTLRAKWLLQSQGLCCPGVFGACPLCSDLQLSLPFAQHRAVLEHQPQALPRCLGAGWTLGGSSALLPPAQGIQGCLGGVGMISSSPGAQNLVVGFPRLGVSQGAWGAGPRKCSEW